MKKDLWKTKDIKKSGRNILKNNFSTLVMVSLFLTLIFGGSIGNRTGYSVFTEVFEQIQNVLNYRQTKSEKEVIKDSLDKILSQYLSGNMNGFIKEYNEKNNVYSGFIFSAFNFISNSENEIQNFVKSISADESKIHSARAVLIIFTSIGIFIRILFINPIQVGEKSIYIDRDFYKNIVYKSNTSWRKKTVFREHKLQKN